MSKLHFFPTLEEASAALALHVLSIAQETVLERGVLSMVLAGGKTPRVLYQILGSPPIADAMPWDETHLFWGDERCVPPDHEASNFRLAHESFLKRIALPRSNIHRIIGEMVDPRQAACLYEREIREFFSLTEPAWKEKELTAAWGFDIVLLGMGEDGHVASLFPGHGPIEEEKRLVVATDEAIGSPPSRRITMTIPLINRSRAILFLVSGEKKRRIAEEILRDPIKTAGRYPAARVRSPGSIHWYMAGD